MQDGDSLRIHDQSRSEQQAGGEEEALAGRAPLREWRRFVPAGKSGRLERELRRRQKSESRRRGRRQRMERWRARRRNRELAKLEKQLLGRGPTGIGSRLSVSIPRRIRSGAEVERDTAEGNPRISQAVDAALARQREQLWTEFQRSVEFRISLAAKAMQQRQEETERRVIERAEKSINRVTDDMWRSVERRLNEEADRIEKEVERSVGAEMSRMYLRQSRPPEGPLPGLRP